MWINTHNLVQFYLLSVCRAPKRMANIAKGKGQQGHCSLLQLHIFLDTTRVVLHDSKIILIYPALGLVQPLSSTTVWNSPF